MDISKIEQQLKKNNLLLLGEIYVSEEMYGELLAYARQKVRRLVANPYLAYSPRPDLALALAMVQVAIRHYKEGRYWKEFHNQIGIDDISPSDQGNIGDIFITTIRKYHLFELGKKEHDERKYVENIKAHAFVTDYYMQGFFDFAYAYYENNLFRQLPDDISDDLKDLSEFMKGVYAKNKDTVSSGDVGTKTGKTYKLLKSTQAVFAQASSENLQEIFYPILCMIDKYWYEGELPQRTENRFANAFSLWCQEREKTAEKAKGKKRKERIAFSHKPYLHADPENETAKLTIPKQKFRNEECNGEVSAEITINGYMETRKLELYTHLGIYISEEVSIPIPDIFSKIDICLAGGGKKYQIPGCSYRIFDEQWNSVSKFSDGHNYLLTGKGIPVFWKNKDDIIDFYNGSQAWDFYSVNINGESVCNVDGHPLSLIGEFTGEPMFEKPIEKYMVTKEGREITAAASHPVISFIVPTEKMGGTFLDVNGRHYMLPDIKEKTCCDWPEDHTKAAVTMALEEVLGHVGGYFIIRLDIPGEPVKRLCEYLVIKEFDCKWNKPRFMYDAYAGLTVKHPQTEIMNIPETWETLPMTDNGRTAFQIPLTADLSEISFDFLMDGFTFTLTMPLKIFQYGFSKEDMRIDRLEYLWYGDLRETLYVKIPGAVSAEVYYGHDESKKAEGQEIEPGLFRMDIFPFKEIIENEQKLKYQYLSVNYVDNAKRKVSLPPILRNLLAEPYFELDYSEEDGVYTEIHSIKGKADLYLTVKDHGSRNTVIEYRKCREGKNMLPELKKDGYYDLYPIMEESDEFGFESVKTPLKIKRGVGIVDIRNLVNCRLTLERLICDEDTLPLEFSYFIFLTEKEEENTYIGHMNCIKMVNGKYDRDTEKKFGRIRMTLYPADRDFKASMELYSYREEMWMDPYYDTERNIILSCDDTLLDKKHDIDRFILLDIHATEYLFNRKSIRRIR